MYLYSFDVKLAYFLLHLHKQGLYILLCRGSQPWKMTSKTLKREFLAEIPFCELMLGCNEESLGKRH